MSLRIDKVGSRFWYNSEGQLHRINGPAIEYRDGTKAWYLNDKKHRENGPAVEDIHGNKYWYLNGKRHRLDGPAIEYSNGYKEWYFNGIEYTGRKYWAREG